MLRSRCPLLSAALSLFLALPALSLGQQSEAPSEPAAEPASLTILVLVGDGAINNIEKRVVTEPVVEVHDEEGRPVAGAEVEFRLPATGPGATFYGASRSATVTTDESGRAAGRGLSPNTEEGTFTVEVIASYGSKSATASFTQTNAVAPEIEKPRSRVPGWRLISAIAAGVTIGVTAAVLRGGDDNVPPTSISLGSVSVGAPR